MARLLLAVLLVISSTIVKADGYFMCAPPTTKYYTMMDGNWTDNAIWSNSSHTGPGCTCNPGCPLNANSDIYVAHNVTANCLIDIGSILL